MLVDYDLLCVNTLGAGPSLLLLSPWTPRKDNGGVFSLSGVRTCGMEHKSEHNTNTENGKLKCSTKF